jgi:hypothetical protein
MRSRVEELRAVFEKASPEERNKIASVADEMNMLDSEALVDRYLRPEQNPGIPDPHVPRESPDIPNLLKLTPCELFDRLNGLRASYRITLNLSNLRAEDVLELLFECNGAISDLEIFNLKDFSSGKAVDYKEISQLQRAIKDENPIGLKKFVRAMIERMEDPERIEKFHNILRNISSLQACYKKGPLRSRIGSDSTGHSRRLHGMGLAVLETLPQRAQREVRLSQSPQRLMLPVRTEVFFRYTFVPQHGSHRSVERADSRPGAKLELFKGIVARIPGLRCMGRKAEKSWEIREPSTRIVTRGNILTLGGVSPESGNGLELFPSTRVPKPQITWNYLNTTLKDLVKIVAGFVPAFATFYLTKDWWVLAWFGAFIWFGITGLRNIVQAVFGAGGISRSHLFKWDSYISWERISDSLLFTGFSVPLLDYIVKTLILDRSFTITASNNPVLLYTSIAIANGIYTFSHNTWRGTPQAAATANLFRTVLSTPLAVLLNMAAGGVMSVFGVADISGMLQKWAAIISKTASDCVAGVIEGLADRHELIQTRAADYASKLGQLLDAYAKLELMYPEDDVLSMLESPKDFIMRLSSEARDLEKIVIINALDLLYFRMYQPRAQNELCALLQGMTEDERPIFVRSQSVLKRKHEVSQLFLDGIVGKRFAKALSFYLDRSEEYLNELEKLAERPCGKAEKRLTGLTAKG